MGTLKLMAVGDISLQTRSDRHPFENVKEVFKRKDILFGNLETVLSSEGRKAKKAVLLYSPPENVKYLKDMDFDVLNVANNHILDLGVDGFRNTLDMLNKNDLNFIGANNDKSISNHLILERNGIKFGFLGYTIGRFKVPEGISLNKFKEKKIVADIESIKDKCDFVIVSLHWGTENVFYPSPKQIDLAHNLIDHGAALILGHHPHVVQGIEKYKKGLIVYSLGNFQFNPFVSYSPNNESFILLVELTKSGLKDHEIIPVKIDKDFAPYVPAEDEQEEIQRFVSEISQHINNDTITWGWWFEKIAYKYISDNLKSYIIRIKRYGFRHFLECGIWLISPFCLRCYVGIIKQELRRLLILRRKS